MVATLSILDCLPASLVHLWLVTLKGIIHLVHSQNFPKNSNFLPPDTYTLVYQGVRNVSFSKIFAYVLNEWFQTNLKRTLMQIIYFVISHLDDETFKQEDNIQTATQ